MSEHYIMENTEGQKPTARGKKVKTLTKFSKRVEHRCRARLAGTAMGNTINTHERQPGKNINKTKNEKTIMARHRLDFFHIKRTSKREK